ncbi:MAG: SDR family NAD(P)-dependent oxidoreductase [Candidatus Brocadia sp.]|nr:SDR family NAD(P)-dependent oxidoreductase [Candidatus Brocadia sp.]
MQSFRLIALTPPGLTDPSIAIAASRAGEIGVIDLEYVKSEQDGIDAISRLVRYTKKDCGIKLYGGDGRFVANIISKLPRQVDVVILTYGNPDALLKQVQQLKSQNITVLLEVTSPGQALLWNEEKIDGLVAKGNESAGLVGEETSFILLQRLLKSVSLPVWIQGGIGLHTAAACYAAGAAGVVLDVQLALTRESTLPEMVRTVIARADGGESASIGDEIGAACRVYSRSGLPVIQELHELLETLTHDTRPHPEILNSWRQAIRDRVGWSAPEQNVWLLGQDAALAASLARRFCTVGGILDAFRQAIDSHIRTAKTLNPLHEGSPLASSHGTRYPIAQGPMARLTDVPAFAQRIAQGGALPFLAIAMMRAQEIKEMLEETRRLLGDKPWGVGILGFISPDLFQEQLDVIKTYKPPFALIAGGRPDQSHALEREGIHTYLHVPSPGLLKMFLENKARRFIFEGRECGGHVGPRTSFVLWDTLLDTLLESLRPEDVPHCHVLFAGGIHDALSASMVSALAAPFAERGGKTGVLLGTAYLFTEEATGTGAIIKGFQEEAIQCTRTVLLESGHGHAVRCADTPYTKTFMDEKLRLITEGRSAEEIRNTLEELNLGRLRIATKGVIRNPRDGQDIGASKYIVLSEEEQHKQGIYMIGQLAAMRKRTSTIEEIHHEISAGSSKRLMETGESERLRISAHNGAKPCDVAIIGMACILPKANNLETYWMNILNKVDAITEVPADRWDSRLYFDPDQNARDKVYSKWGGFIDPVPFNPTQYGMPPNTLQSIEPFQLLTLEVVRKAIENAGYADRPFPRKRTSVIFGASGGISELGIQYAFRSCLPEFVKNVSSDVMTQLPEWTEDSFAGILFNVAAGRVANRFDFGGVNYTVDAACASSLAAVYLAVRELENETSDMVIVGGTDTMQSPFSYLCFSKTHALSPRGRCRTFDEAADGIVISEGIATLVLKRLSDAERDGDRIYAVIKAISGSSDGRDKGLTAPRPEGQALALERVYDKAGFSPAIVGLVEAHGTGTVAGDRAEVETLRRVFEAAGATPQSCAIGSVKSMIGHTKSTAGVAGLIKIALSLYHKILPPTIGVEKPNPIIAGSPFYVNTETRPWICGATGQPRRAGVSAFGFGGTNFHAVVEEYTGNFLPVSVDCVPYRWASELFLWTGHSRQELSDAIGKLHQALSHGARPALSDLAYTVWKHSRNSHECRLAAVATSLEDLQQKLTWAKESLNKAENSHFHDPRGIYFAMEPLAKSGKIAFLFPGQGSQYPDMPGDLAILFPEVRDRFERADRVLANRFPRPLSAYVFPPPRFNRNEEQACQQMLTKTNIAQPALGAVGMGLFHLLQTFGIKPDMVAGHSYGEYVALCAAGVFSEDVLYSLSEARGRFIMEMGDQDLGTMAAVDAGREPVADALQSVREAWIANLNAPRQTIISGTRPSVEELIKRFEAMGIRARLIPVACAFHSALVAPARDRLAEFLSTIEIATPGVDVFSNTSALLYPQHPKEIIALLSDHLINPVKFADEIETMYNSGARIFIEVGPRNVLTGLTRQILDGRPYLAVALDAPGQAGVLHLHHALGQLAANGVHLDLGRLFHGRGARHLKLNMLAEETREQLQSPMALLVDGKRIHFPRKVTEKKFPPESRSQEKTTENVQYPMQATQPKKTAVYGAVTENVTTTIPEGAPHPPKPSVTVPPQTTSPVPPSPSGGGDGEVILQFQKIMNRFLEIQQQVMLAYLKGGQIPPSEISEILGRQSSQIQTFPASQPAETPVQLTQEPVPVKTEPPTQASVRPTPSQHPEPVPVQEQRPTFDKEGLTSQLLQIVSERTGYPTEMLGLDLNMEADLGIDSIKRVEIFGTLQRVYLSTQGTMQMAMEELTKIKTLRGIIDYICNAVQAPFKNQVSIPDSEQKKAEIGQVAHGESNGKDDVSRFLLMPVNVPLSARPLQLTSSPVFIVTDDEGGISTTFSDKIRHLGGRVVLVRAGVKTREAGRDLYTVDLCNLTAVTDFCNLVRKRYGPITGIIHLLPMKKGKPFKEMDIREWKERLRLEVKGLFSLAKCAAVDLKEAAKAGGGYLIVATGMGGTFAVDEKGSPSFFPGNGGIAGLVKTIACEWPSVCSRVIDFDPGMSASVLSDHVLSEMAGRDKEVEVGYRNSQRMAFRLRPASISKDDLPGLEIGPDWVVLVTGGAKGITAEIACELAKHYRPTLVLAGRAPLPASHESPETAKLTTPQELKAALIGQMRQSKQSFTPAQVEAACLRLLQEREMRNNILTMQQAGATVRYHQADVTDERAFGDLIEDIYRSYGRLDGVIHGAGVIEDKLIEEKSPDSFDRVFDTKVDSAFILSRKLRADSLKFLVFFSSVAGRFGNRGQGDYVAANEVMNKLAVYLDGQWAGRVVSINWGPWDKTGMVSPEVKRQFAERGVQLIPPLTGRRMLDEELRLGKKGEVEIVIGDGPWEKFTGEAQVSPSANEFPLLEDIPATIRDDGLIEIIRTFDVSQDIYLHDHRIDGKPVLPMAMAMELMAEVVQKGWPGKKVAEVRDLRVLRGVVLEQGRRDVRIVVKPQAQVSHELSEMDFDVKITELGQANRLFYCATVKLADRFAMASSYSLPHFDRMEDFPITVEEAYRQWLFHGPRFQCLSKIEGISTMGIVSIINAPLASPQQCLANTCANRWLLNPVIVDNGLQPIILWARKYRDMMALPSGFKKFCCFEPFPDAPLRCYIQHIFPDSEGLVLRTDIFFVSLKGNLIAMMEGLESTCSKALNRIVGVPVISGNR